MRCNPSPDRTTLPDLFDDLTTGSGNTAVPGANITYAQLFIRRANLSELPAGGFQRFPSHFIDLTGNRFVQETSISPAAFIGLEFIVNTLVLADCGLTAVPSASLSHLARLDILRLDVNSIVSLPAGVFSSHGSVLRELHLYKNSINHVDLHAFDGLEALEKLNLAENRIVSLSPKVFSALGNLTSLDVSVNELLVLEPGWLDGLSSLQWLEVHSNRIRSIGIKSFRGATRLRYMRAENNALLSIDDDSFRSINRLNYLSIDLSNVTALTNRTLAGLSRLRTLILGELRRATLPIGFFTSLRRLKNLSLYDYEGYLPQNTAIPVELFNSRLTFRHLSIWLAPIRGCRCSAQWIRRIGVLGAYVHGLCPNKKQLSCPAGGKMAASSGGRKTTVKGKRPNDRRRYRSGHANKPKRRTVSVAAEWP